MGHGRVVQSPLKDVATEGTHISSEEPEKPPGHTQGEDAEEPPLGEGTLGGLWGRGSPSFVRQVNPQHRHGHIRAQRFCIS